MAVHLVLMPRRRVRWAAPAPPSQALVPQPGITANATTSSGSSAAVKGLPRVFTRYNRRDAFWCTFVLVVRRWPRDNRPKTGNKPGAYARVSIGG